MRAPNTSISLASKLGLGALVLALGAVIASGIGIWGLSQSSARIEDALKADERLTGYSALSSQISSLALVAYDPAAQTDTSNTMSDRIDGLVRTIEATFSAIGTNLQIEVERAANLGLDEQSRRATRSLNLARMQATFQSLVTAINDPAATSQRVATDLNIFSSRFQPLLASAIQEEQRIRDTAYRDVARIRIWLTRAAIVTTVLTLLALTWFYFRLIRPQIARLDRLPPAARAIAAENFDQQLPETPGDEIGALFFEVNRMAEQLGQDRAQLSQTIAERTEELRDARDKLLLVDENRRRFFADISHEMRTPLTVILMEAELAQKEAPSAETFPAIISRARLLSRRIDDLLRISKSESGILTIEREPFDLCDAAFEAYADLKRRADRAKFDLSIETMGPCPALGDQNWMRQVITGLIDNALRHSGDKGRIRIEVVRGAHDHSVHVVDDGKGIPAADQADIFSRFSRGANNTSQGFGIGLGLVAWVVAEHGGEISLASPPDPAQALETGRGTAITFTLPNAAERDDTP